MIVENVGYLRGRDGIEVQARSAWLITIRDGELTSLTLHQTKQEALEAAGLRSRRCRRRTLRSRTTSGSDRHDEGRQAD